MRHAQPGLTVALMLVQALSAVLILAYAPAAYANKEAVSGGYGGRQWRVGTCELRSTNRGMPNTPL